MWRAENIQACLRDFLAATASMACKRHLASSARGLFGFCLMASIHRTIRCIRPIRGRKRKIARGQTPGSSKVTVRSLRRRLILYCQRQLFCFVAFPSASKADQSAGEGQTGKLAYMAEHTHQAAMA